MAAVSTRYGGGGGGGCLWYCLRNYGSRHGSLLTQAFQVRPMITLRSSSNSYSEHLLSERTALVLSNHPTRSSSFQLIKRVPSAIRTDILRHWSSSNGGGDDDEKTVVLDMTNLYREWTLEQDQALWYGHQNEKKTLVELAVLTGRGLGGVRARLAKLQDVNSAAYQRLFVQRQRQNKKENDGDQEEEEEDRTKKKLVPVSEVLRRIQWDYNLKESDFSILHYDRVEDRLLETSVDAANENISGIATRFLDALPEHRIMAVKYRQRIVWDRKERLDLMFDGCGIEQVMATYDEWKQEHDAAMEQMERRRTQICYQVRLILGSEGYAKLEQLVSDIQVDMTAGSLISKLEIETLVEQAQQLLLDVRGDSEQRFDPTCTPLGEYDRLDILSEWIVHLPPDLCSERLKSTILQEIGAQLQEHTGSSKQSSGSSNNRSLPDINEADLTETFVRGSGPGGQKINKTSNKVVLVHNPTQLRVECQDTRSLPQNRKIARKRLREKLDQFFNGSQSKAHQAAQIASTKKAKSKARNRARQQRKKLEKEQQQVAGQMDDKDEDEDYNFR